MSTKNETDIVTITSRESEIITSVVNRKTLAGVGARAELPSEVLEHIATAPSLDLGMEGAKVAVLDIFCEDELLLWEHQFVIRPDEVGLESLEYGDNPLLLTATETATLQGVNEQTVWKWCRQGRITHVRITSTETGRTRYHIPLVVALDPYIKGRAGRKTSTAVAAKQELRRQELVKELSGRIVDKMVQLGYALESAGPIDHHEA